MDLRKLRHVVALAEELNFARAARKVNLTQPALTRSLQAIEGELGGRLFDRDRRGVALTSIGRSVVRRAQALLLDAGNLRREVRLMQDCELGDIRMGVGPFPGATFLPPVLADLAREHPHLRVEVEINNAQQLLKHLLDEEIEFFVADARVVPPDPHIAVAPFARQYGGFFCRAGHPLAGKRIRSPAEVLDYGFASVRLPAELRAQLARYLGKSPDAFGSGLICDNPAVTRFVALASDLVLLSSYAAVQDDLAAGTLVTLEMPRQPLFYAKTAVISLAGRTLSPVGRWLVARMGERAERLAAKHPARPRAKRSVR